MESRATVFVRVVNKEGHTAFVLNTQKPLPPDLKTGEARTKPKGWSIPGGRVRHNEMMIEAAERECREEAGLEIDQNSLREIPGAFEQAQNGKPEVYVFYTHEFKFINGTGLTTRYEAEESAGVIEARWASDSEWERGYLLSNVDGKEYPIYGAAMRRIKRCNDHFHAPR